MARLALLVTSAFLLCSTVLPAADTPPVDPVWRAEHVVNQARVGEIDVNPDGLRAVWVLRRPDDEKHRLVSDLRLSSLAGGSSTVSLTRTSDSDSEPRFSPDGGRIAFLSDRDLPGKDMEEYDTPQVWVILAGGGEPRSVSSFRRGVEAFDWLDDSTLVVLANPDPDLRQRRLDTADDDTEVFEDETHWVPTRLWLLDLEEGTAKPLTHNDDEIDLFAVDRTHRRVVARHLPHPHWEADQRGTPKLILRYIDSGVSHHIPVSRSVLPTSLVFTTDGGGLLATYTETARPDLLAAGCSRLAFWRDDTPSFFSIQPLGNEEILDAIPTETGALALVGDGALTHLALLERDGQTYRLRPLEGDATHVSRLAASPDGARIVAVRSRADEPAQLWRLALADLRVTVGPRLSKLNPHLDGKSTARMEVVSWEGAEGDTVEGLLFHPTTPRREGTAPLVVMIHGGPVHADRDVWDDDWAAPVNALAQRGAYVLRPNYHGSSGYGQAFTESIMGRYYELEVPDILAGIDSLVERGLVDTDRVGLSGWSNGAILSIALSLERPFAAVAAGAGDVNWTSDFGNCAFGPNFDRYYIGGEPWTEPERYVAASPLFRMEEISSPTIIFFGTKDTSVPTEQGYEHFRAMQQIGKAPVRLLLFPDQPHSLGNLVHQQRKLEEELEWFDVHLFGRASTADDPVGDASPLAVARAAAGLARRGGRLGTSREPSLLIPETREVAALPGLAVGAVEVTSAQWAAFDGGEVIDSAADSPAAVQSAERARAYCEWLTHATGRSWRLPTVEERSRLEAASRRVLGKPLTLDAWAGGELTHDDATAIRAAAASTVGLDMLLRPAATSEASALPAPAAGPWDAEVILFDLEGSLAEWVGDGDQVRPSGGSAWRAAVESKHPPVKGEPVGLRVIMEPD